MPLHAVSKQIRTTHKIPSGASNSELSTYMENDSQAYYATLPTIASVSKEKSGQYAHTLFSVADRSDSTPMLVRVLNFAHTIVHHPVSQAVDCLLSIYIALLIILKVPRELRLDFDAYRSTDFSTLFISSYAVCLVVFTSELILELLARYSSRAEAQKQHHAKKFGFFNFATDLLVCSSLAVDIILYLNDSDYGVNFIGLRVFKIFKYLRVWNQFSDLDNILESVYDSMAMMANIFSALVVTLALYCIIAVQLFSNTFYSICMLSSNISAPLIPVQYCELSSHCPSGFICVESVDNLPLMGTYAFDNSWNALIQLVQVVLPDHWPPIIMHPVSQANPSIVVVVRFYFYSLVVFDALILLNLCIAVMSFAFQRIRDSAKKLESETPTEDPKLQALRSIAMEINPSIFSKHVKHSFNSKLSSNIVVPEVTTSSVAEADNVDIDSALPPAPGESGQSASGFRRKAKHISSRPPTAHVSSLTSQSNVGFATAWAKFHYVCLHFVNLPAFEYFILVVVCLNCLLLAVPYRGIPDNITNILDIVELVFTSIFLFEMLLKIISFGPWKYILENWFDFIVIIFSVVDILTTYAFTAQQLPNLTVLRMFRVLRIFRALKRIKKLMQVLGMIFKSGAALRNLLIFAFVWFSAVAVVGKEIFGLRELVNGLDKSKFDRMNFDTIMNSYELLFRVATGEAWSSLMHKFMLVKYDSVLIENEPKIVNETNTAPAFFFFVPFYLFANFILINVLVSVILENFEVSNVDRAEEYMQMLSAEDDDIREHQKSSLRDAKASIFEWFLAQQAQEQIYIRKISLYSRKISNSHVSDSSLSKKTSSESQSEQSVSQLPSLASSERSKSSLSRNPSEDRERKSPSPEKGLKLSRSQSSVDSLDASKLRSSSALPWTPSFIDHFRILSYKVLKSSWYPYVLYGTIALSSFTLAFTPAKHETTVLDDPPYVYINIVFWAIFFLEFAFNVLLSPISYFCMAWNLLDFVILVLTTIDLLGSLNVIRLRLAFFRVIRLVRALRPLRMLNKNENIRNVVNTVIGSLSSVAYVVALYLILCLMFSVVALQLFRAKMDSCNDDLSEGFYDCIGTFLQAAHEGPNTPPVLMPRVWATAKSNFDNVGRGMIALFRVTTMQWTTIYFSICDIVDEDKNLEENANSAQGLFILSFIVIAGYCIINMFVAVIVEFFKTSSGSRLLTPWQKSWVQTRRFVSALKFETPAPKNKLRHALHRIVHHNYFELLISCVIFANGLVMLLQSRNQSAQFEAITELVNDIALFIFIVEMILKIVAFGPLTYCSDNWNLFDASLVIFSITMNYFIQGSSFESAGQLLRLLRLFRLLRLIRQFNSFKILWDAFVISVWPILNIFLLIFLFFWIYSVIGVSQFGHTRPGVNWVGSGFDTFPRTFLTLGNLVSGENWDSLFDDVSVEYPLCTEDTIGTDGEILVVGDCGNQAAAAIYFIMFILIIRFMLMNLFLAVVVENFSICFEPIEGLIEHEHVDHFLKVFACFCHKEHKFSTLQEYLTYWNSQREDERENIYGDPSDLLHRSHLQKFLNALRVNPKTGEQAGMTGYSNPLGGHLLGYHGRRHYLCVRAEIENFIREKMLREAPFSARMQKYFIEKWRWFKKMMHIWFLKLTRQTKSVSTSSQESNDLAQRKAYVLRRFRKAAVMAYRQSTGQSLTASNRHGWQYMVEQLRMREQERLQNSLSREELFTILITWSVPITHLTEIERRKRQEIVDHFHRQSAQQLIHAMFVGRKVRAARHAAAAGSKSKFVIASKFMSKASKPLFKKILENEETFEEIECSRRASSKVPDQMAVAEEQEAFVRTCIKSKSQMVSSKKLLDKIMRDCMASQMKLTELACPEESQTNTPMSSARQTSPIQLSVSKKGKEATYSSPMIPGAPL